MKKAYKKKEFNLLTELHSDDYILKPGVSHEWFTIVVCFILEYEHPRTAHILSMRYGLTGLPDGKATFDSIGKYHGRSKDRIRQIVLNIQRQLRFKKYFNLYKHLLDKNPRLVKTEENPSSFYW